MTVTVTGSKAGYTSVKKTSAVTAAVAAAVPAVVAGAGADDYGDGEGRVDVDGGSGDLGSGAGGVDVSVERQWCGDHRGEPSRR